MAELVDPEKLVSIGEVAESYGYHPKYFSRLAATGKIRAWRIGNLWATTHDHIREYLRTAAPKGRPKKAK